MRSLFAAAIVLLLAACAAAPAFTVPAQGTRFELSGRIAVKLRAEAITGNIAWRHADASDELLLTSPLGQGMARIVRIGDAVTLTAQDGREMHAADAESLTEQALGFRLPLAGLANWVRGRVAPGPAPIRQTMDAAGRLAELEQSGWKIRYLEYADVLPSRLTLTYPDVELRLAISEWNSGP